MTTTVDAILEEISLLHSLWCVKLKVKMSGKKRTLRINLVSDKDMKLPKRVANVVTILLVVGGAGMIVNPFLGIAFIAAGAICPLKGENCIPKVRRRRLREQFFYLRQENC